MNRLRGAVLGCGMIAEFHLARLEPHPGSRIVALANRTLARGRSAAARFAPAARVYGHPAEMIARERSTSSTS